VPALVDLCMAALLSAATTSTTHDPWSDTMKKQVVEGCQASLNDNTVMFIIFDLGKLQTQLELPMLRGFSHSRVIRVIRHILLVQRPISSRPLVVLSLKFVGGRITFLESIPSDYAAWYSNSKLVDGT
jgi:hypothetical protein